jgi:hypothetical protein
MPQQHGIAMLLLSSRCHPYDQHFYACRCCFQDEIYYIYVLDTPSKPPGFTAKERQRLKLEYTTAAVRHILHKELGALREHGLQISIKDSDDVGSSAGACDTLQTEVVSCILDHPKRCLWCGIFQAHNATAKCPACYRLTAKTGAPLAAPGAVAARLRTEQEQRRFLARMASWPSLGKEGKAAVNILQKKVSTQSTPPACLELSPYVDSFRLFPMEPMHVFALGFSKRFVELVASLPDTFEQVEDRLRDFPW